MEIEDFKNLDFGISIENFQVLNSKYFNALN